MYGIFSSFVQQSIYDSRDEQGFNAFSPGKLSADCRRKYTRLCWAIKVWFLDYYAHANVCSLIRHLRDFINKLLHDKFSWWLFQTETRNFKWSFMWSPNLWASRETKYENYKKENYVNMKLRGKYFKFIFNQPKTSI